MASKDSSAETGSDEDKRDILLNQLSHIDDDLKNIDLEIEIERKKQEVEAKKAYLKDLKDKKISPTMGHDAIGNRDGLEKADQKYIETAGIIHTSKEYRFLNLAGVLATKQKSLVFQVRASNDAHIGLFYDKPNMVTAEKYEIVIGGWGNKRSVIQKGILTQQPDHSVCSDEYLSKNEYREFWITWTDGIIRVGYGGHDKFMEWKDPHPYDINYVAISTGWGSEGDWIFNPTTRLIHTTKEYKFLKLADVLAANQKSLVFQVRASNDAHIGLFYGTPNIRTAEKYEIIIGGWRNRWSVIIKGLHTQPPVHSVSSNGFLKKNEYREFWITWTDGSIQVGYGHVIGDDKFMEWKDPNPYEINHMAISTGWGSDGDWILNPTWSS